MMALVDPVTAGIARLQGYELLIIDDQVCARHLETGETLLAAELRARESYIDVISRL